MEERVAKYTTRSIKKASKSWGLKLAVSMVDLTPEFPWSGNAWKSSDGAIRRAASGPYWRH